MADGTGALVQMFFLGAGFMLVETKAVVHMALLFGGTWIVNSVVIFAVLVMILAANLFVFAAKPVRLGPYYAGLFLSLTISALVPMEYFLGMDRTVQIAGASALAFVPILFAGRDLRGVVLTSGRSRPRLRRQHRRRDVRRVGGVQLDGPGIQILAVRRGRALCSFLDRNALHRNTETQKHRTLFRLSTVPEKGFLWSSGCAPWHLWHPTPWNHLAPLAPLAPAQNQPSGVCLNVPVHDVSKACRSAFQLWRSIVICGRASRSTLKVLSSPRLRVDSVPAWTTSAECPAI